MPKLWSVLVSCTKYVCHCTVHGRIRGTYAVVDAKTLVDIGVLLYIVSIIFCSPDLNSAIYPIVNAEAGVGVSVLGPTY